MVVLENISIPFEYPLCILKFHPDDVSLKNALLLIAGMEN